MDLVEESVLLRTSNHTTSIFGAYITNVKMEYNSRLHDYDGEIHDATYTLQASS